jgi:hypothetical protein
MRAAPIPEVEPVTSQTRGAIVMNEDKLKVSQVIGCRNYFAEMRVLEVIVGCY